ncbi:unnamed protein product [Fusarium graminearum]|uniref:Chromosome 4, complete genome n=1 Tax=Gibberella zeae (strain ATCC MYA-4620 / CBS 123657 / FGSC 9075 / NRRL 31084 / PH-1) TaxID=229533 RepID=A0A098DUY1_GIBZE|nr:unnamed protein product [Fusarium graminearum]
MYQNESKKKRHSDIARVDAPTSPWKMAPTPAGRSCIAQHPWPQAGFPNGVVH